MINKHRSLCLMVLVTILLYFAWLAQPQTYGLTGKVIDSNGNALNNVELTFSGEKSSHTSSEKDGSWKMAGLEGEMKITPKKEGWIFPSYSVSSSTKALKIKGVFKEDLSSEKERNPKQDRERNKGQNPKEIIKQSALPPDSKDNPAAEPEKAVLAPVVPNTSGVVFTFDDNNIDEWYSFLEFNIRYGAKATFYVCSFDKLSEKEYAELKDLQKANNEIGYHTLNHLNALKLIKEKSIDYYLQTEILPGIALMREKGFEAKSFAYPFGAGNEELDKELLKYFSNVRYTAYSYHTKIKDMDSVYLKNRKTKVTQAVGIDDGYGHSLQEILEGIDRARKNNEVILFYGHKIARMPGKYHVSMDRLEAIIKYVSAKGMKFYTISELGD